MNTIEVLDRGFVRLVSYMQPVPDLLDSEDTDCAFEGRHRGSWSGDLEIVRNARVSYNADWRSGESEKGDDKLIGYLLRNRHTSPFEAMVFTFEIKCPIFIARQWHRHRTWSYNEVSARYTELDEGYYVPAPEQIGNQSKDNKQARDRDTDVTNDHRHAAMTIEQHSERCFWQYRHLIDIGVPRELARSVLSVNFYTRFFGTVDLHNLFHFLSLRWHPHAQYEIQEYARALWTLARNVCPSACDHWVNINRSGE